MMIDILHAIITYPTMTTSRRSVSSTSFTPLHLDHLSPDPQNPLNWNSHGVFWISKSVSTWFEGCISQNAGWVRVQVARDDTGIAEGGDEHVDDRKEENVSEEGGDGGGDVMGEPGDFETVKETAEGEEEEKGEDKGERVVARCHEETVEEKAIVAFVRAIVAGKSLGFGR